MNQKCPKREKAFILFEYLIVTIKKKQHISLILFLNILITKESLIYRVQLKFAKIFEQYQFFSRWFLKLSSLLLKCESFPN